MTLTDWQPELLGRFMLQTCKDLILEGPDKENVLEQMKTGRYTFLVDVRGNFRADHMELVEPAAENDVS